MAVSELFTDGEGRVPVFQSREINDQTWVTLGGDLDRLPSYVSGRPVPQDDSMAPESDKTFRGRLRTIKEVHLPDWYEPLFHWRAFWPTDPLGSGELRRLFLDDSSVPADPSYPPNTITPRTDVKDCYKDLYGQINRVVEDAGWRIIPCAPKTLWSFKNPWDLDKPFESMAAMQKAAAEVKLQLLEGIAWMRWLHAVLPQIYKHSAFLTVKDDFLKSCLPDLPSRGVVINLTKDWREISVGFWLSAKVPVYYPWRLEERVEARFAKLSPILLSTHSSEEHVALDEIDNKGNWEEIANQSAEHDEFFQLKDPGFESIYETFEMGPSTEFFVIDFEGWGRRALLATLEISDYRNALHFRIDSDGFDNSVTFWRWRPRDRALALRLHSHMDNLHNGNPLRVIRELWKDFLAPRAGQVYDLESGFLLDTPPLPETRRLSGGAHSFLVPGKPSTLGWRIDPRDYTHWTRGSSRQSTDEDSMDVSSEEDRPPTLLHRLNVNDRVSLATPPPEERSVVPPNAPLREQPRALLIEDLGLELPRSGIVLCLLLEIATPEP
ncbi:LOW QUALITY PROTEIN: hypothetical protein CVT26_008869 [Gymnopilus dilepis]|uniref:Uncharacterized protein n=1 Tax=Gymnopilus dilepis TaxID=231916 RepID=A0A409WUB9_9AGAR|nr:LOW QUALITY PROTEIN: hypothetical protein CVT26_008869 [Gymnopilus dilepis]